MASIMQWTPCSRPQKGMRRKLMFLNRLEQNRPQHFGCSTTLALALSYPNDTSWTARTILPERYFLNDTSLTELLAGITIFDKRGVRGFLLVSQFTAMVGAFVRAGFQEQANMADIRYISQDILHPLPSPRTAMLSGIRRAGLPYRFMAAACCTPTPGFVEPCGSSSGLWRGRE